MKKYTAGLLLLAFIIAFGTGGSLQAQKKQEVTISPFLKEVRFEASDPTLDFTVNLTNNTDATQEFSLSALDFGSLDETGGIVFAGSKANALKSK